MAGLTLTYREDPRTGLPRLEDPGGGLPADVLAALGRELGRRYERLAHGPDRQYLTLDAPAGAGVPRCFRVTVTERAKRCPTLLLEAAEPPAPAPPHEAPPERWQAQFLAEAAEWLAGVAPAGADRAPLEFVVADLRAVLRKDPRQLTRLLFAGYLHLGDALSRRHGAPGVSPYARAARALARLAGDSLPGGACDLPPSRAAAGPAGSPGGWLRRFFALE